MPDNVLDVFGADAFSIVEMTRAIRRLPTQWGRIGQMGIFGPGRGITSKVALVEIENGKLVLIDSAERGGSGPLLADDRREMHAIPVPHFPKKANVYADEVSGVRAFGTGGVYETVQGVVAAKLQKLKRGHVQTREYLYARALHGVVIDPRGKVLFDSFARFGVPQTTVNFDLGNPDSPIGAHCRKVVRHISTNLNGDVMTGVHALCSPEWFEKFVSHPVVAAAYAHYLAPGNPLRDDVSRAFPFQGIVFEEYAAQSQASDGTLKRYIDAEKVRFFPVGTTDTFDQVFAPADWIETVNTVGLDFYAAVEPMADRKKGVTIDTQSNPLPMCLNPSVLVEGT